MLAHKAALQERNAKLGEPTILQQAGSKLALCLVGRHFLIPQGCALQEFARMGEVVGLPLQTVSDRVLIAGRTVCFISLLHK